MKESLTLAAVFLAGLLSFASPCVLPLLPVYASILTNPAQTKGRSGLLWFNCLSFLSGFVLVFILMGATASFAGQILFDNQETFRKFGAAFMMLMGVHLAGLLKIPFFFREYRPLLTKNFQGPLSSFLLGMALTLGWSPCIGPILTSVLLFAGAKETLREGVYLLLVYALGFCLPFLALTLTVEKWAHNSARFYARLPGLQRAAGGLLFLTGLLLYLDWVNRAIGWLWNLF